MDSNNSNARQVNQQVNQQENRQETPQETPQAADQALLEQAGVLIWALLDDEIAPQDLRRLEEWLRQHEPVRELYVSSVQMHTDLHGHFGKTPSSPATDPSSQSPVLGQLGDLRPSSDSWPPVRD